MEPAQKRPPERNHPAIEEAFARLPSSLVAEIVNGQLHASPRPRPRHGRASSRLGGVLDGPFDRGAGGPGGWILLDEPELHLGARPDKLVPDLAGWRRARVEADTFERAAVTLAPDWVCEVVSPGTEALDRAEKLPVYAREGTAHAWLLDPDEETLEGYRLERGAFRAIATHRGDARVRAEPFDALELDLSLLFRW